MYSLYAGHVLPVSFPNAFSYRDNSIPGAHVKHKYHSASLHAAAGQDPAVMEEQGEGLSAGGPLSDGGFRSSMATPPLTDAHSLPPDTDQVCHSKLNSTRQAVVKLNIICQAVVKLNITCQAVADPALSRRSCLPR